MKILLTGATGYIGKLLLPILIDAGHKVVCSVRDKARFNPPSSLVDFIEVIEVDFLDQNSLQNIPKDIDAAYYLMHAMSTSENYEVLEQQAAQNFVHQVSQTTVKQVIYLSGISNERTLSKHLTSRLAVEQILSRSTFNLTTLRAGIIIGSGSASYEIIRDLVEKLPVMIAPKWLKTKCQPIAVEDVLAFLKGVLGQPFCYDKHFDIGGKDVLNYKQMLLGYAKVRGLKRSIITVPVMSPRLSSYWLYFVTSTSYKLAVALVNSMKIEVVCKPNELAEKLQISPMGYTQAIEKTLLNIAEKGTISSWKDAFISGRFNFKLSEFLTVPTHGCYTDQRSRTFSSRVQTLNKLWAIGGETGWYYANFLWRIRGYLDKLVGGVGLRRGRTNKKELLVGDAVDFWRVLYANKKEGRLLLFAEMRLPGEAWLEFKTEGNKLIQTATFRPKGLSGRLYWYMVLPLHGIIFEGMLRKITSL